MGTVLPYVIGKVAVAASTAWMEYEWGHGGNGTEGVAAEADALQWEYMWMGAAMGGMRAAGILVAVRASRQAGAAAEDTALLTVPGPVRAAKTSGNIFRGRLEELTDPESVITVAMAAGALTTLYCLMASGVLWASGDTFFLHSARMPLRATIARYMHGFAVGALPTQWLYLAGQCAVGLEAPGIALVYDGVLYGGLGVCFAWLWYPRHGVYGLGLAMAASAWVAWLANVLHFVVDPFWRRLLCAGARAVPHTAWRQECVVYLRLAVPLGVANTLGLLQGLLAAALVSQHSDDDAVAYSLSAAYYQTLSIVLLGMGSAGAAVVASRTGTPSAMGAAARRTVFLRVIVTLLCTGSALSALPLLNAEGFAVVFGEGVSALGGGPARVRMLHPLIHRYTFINAAACVGNTTATALAAVAHGCQQVWPATAAHAAASAAGLAWVVAFKDSGTEMIAWGGGAASLLHTALLILLFLRGGCDDSGSDVVSDVVRRGTQEHSTSSLR